MAPVKTERSKQWCSLSSPVNECLCAWALLSPGVHAMALVFHHTVVEGQVISPELNFLLLTFKILTFPHTTTLQAKSMSKNDEKEMPYKDFKNFF